MRGASFLVLLLAAYAAGCGGRAQESSSSPDASADGAGNGGGSSGGDDAGSSHGDDAGDQASDGGVPATFPLGAYGDCTLTTFLQTPGGGGMTGVGGSVTLAQSGSALSVTYGGDGGVLDASFELTQTSDLSASLDPGQQLGGIHLSCAPLDFAPTLVQLGSGALTYNGGKLFLSVVGTADPVDAGAGCSNPGGQAALSITCSAQPASPSLAAGLDAGSSASDFAGVYSCASSVLASSSTLEGTGGGTGTLTITDTGGVLTAAYANDLYVSGTLAFSATSASAALPATANETMQVNCAGSTGSGNPPLTTLPVTGSSLTVDGTSVVLSFAGTMPEGSTCGGAEMNVAVLCAK